MDIQYPVFTVDISSTGEIGAASFSRYTVQLHRMYSMTFFTVYTPYDLQGPDRVGALWGQLSHWYRHRPRGFFPPPPAGHVAALTAAILFTVFEESPKALSHRLFELYWTFCMLIHHVASRWWIPPLPGTGSVPTGWWPTRQLSPDVLPQPHLCQTLILDGEF